MIRNGHPDKVYIDFVYEPVNNFDGSIRSVMVLAIEITDKVIARRHAEFSEERARLAIDAAGMGTFDVDLETSAMVTSERFYQVFGLDKPASRKVYMKMLHAEDLQIWSQAYETAYKTGSLTYEARFILKDKSVRWIRVQGKIYQDNGKPGRLLGTMLDITEMKLLQQQKDDFISVASHELKTPMTSLKASIQLLDRLISSGADTKRIVQFIDRANGSLGKMQHLVDSLLDVSKITADQLVLNKTRFKVSEMINGCCDHVREAGDYELKLTGDLDLEVVADHQRIDQVMVNLVNNAVKYASDSNLILMNISREGGNAKISVQDFGQGIAADKLPHLFKRYYRVDEKGRQYSGLGLGLYISAEIVARHGGKIGVESIEGQGTTFWFKLPVE